MFNSDLRSLFKFEFKCSGVQQRQRGAIVLDSMSFEALSCKGGASISICTSRALIFACTGLVFTWVYYSHTATLYAYSRWYLLAH